MVKFHLSRGSTIRKSRIWNVKDYWLWQSEVISRQDVDTIRWGRGPLCFVPTAEMHEQFWVGSTCPWRVESVSSYPCLGVKRTSSAEKIYAETGILCGPLPMQVKWVLLSSSVSLNHKSTDDQHLQLWGKCVMTLWSLRMDAMFIFFLLKRGVGQRGWFLTNYSVPEREDAIVFFWFWGHQR
jgi:hypothetical protein